MKENEIEDWEKTKRQRELSVITNDQELYDAESNQRPN